MPVPSKMSDLLTLAASNSPAGSDLIGNTLDDYIRSHAAIIRSTNALSSAAIAAASTVDLSTSDGEQVTVTGAATINSLGTVPSGIVRELSFSGICTLTSSTAIVLPFGASITTAAGDIYTFRSLGAGNWVMTSSSKAGNYVPLSGVTPMTGNLTISPAAGEAAVQLSGVVGTNRGVKLSTSGSLRWYILADTTAETGGGAGSNLSLYRANDAGALVDNPVSINRASGNVVVGAGGLNVSGPIANSGATAGISIISSSTNNTSISLQNTSAGGRQWFMLTSGSAWGGALPAGYLVFYDNAGGGTRAYIDTTGNFHTPTGGVFINTSGSSGGLDITDTGAVGAGIALHGDGGTTPNKYIRSHSGQLQFINSVYSAVISSLTDGGIWTATDFQATSDVSLKSDIQPLRRGLDELKRMLPRQYVKNERPEIGFIAQEAQKVIPEAVSENEDGKLCLSYGQVSALLAAAILELDERLTKAGL